jgi:UDP-N-acetylmuramoyl-L-alanyl-D-glutamate--2,6-diaminopimelate ligase
MRGQGARTVALEVSSHALAQHRVDGTWFTAACFTNLSHDHLDYHGTVDEYFAAKLRLFEPEWCAIAVTNIDDPYGRDVAEHAHKRGLDIVTYAVDDRRADIGVESVHLGGRASRFALVDRRADDRIEVVVPLIGRVSVTNALAAAATDLAAGGTLTRVAAGLASAPMAPGRLEPVDGGQPFTVLVDYAHTPDALVHAVGAARDLAGTRRVAVVFGCGGDRDVEKRPAMGEAAAAGDLVVVTSDNPRSEDPAQIAAAARGGVERAGGKPIVELDRRAAVRIALQWAEPGDVVLIAGKGHETSQTIGDRVVAFDDRVVAREELEALACA